MKRISVVSHAGDMDISKSKGKLVVIIDVLRATSVMTTAFMKGVKEIVAFREIEDARAYYARLNPSERIIAGERNAEKPEGFDYGNSPTSLDENIVSGKIMVMSTSNGTRAIEASIDASTMLIASFLNVKAVAQTIVDSDCEEVLIVCAGTQNKFSMDDSLCASAIIQKVDAYCDTELDDLAYILAKQSINRKTLTDLLQNCYHYKLLKTKGYLADLEYCLSLSITDIVPYYKNGKILKS
ncbi:MAG: 2-phosphosulfolactate phosphatase [Hyphomicrobiales bacterium]